MKRFILVFCFCLVLFNTKVVKAQILSESFEKKLSAGKLFLSQINESSEPSFFSGSKILDYHSNFKKPFLFNGTFQFPISIGGDNFVSKEKGNILHVIQFVPYFQVRLFQNDPVFNDKSKPVRTPSYFPKVFHFLALKNCEQSKFFLKYAFYGLGHHSNGQDGYEFVEGTDTVNIYNGSFSQALIGFFGLGGFKIQEKFNVNWKLMAEVHPRVFANEKFYKTGLYGGNRMISSLQLGLKRTKSNNYIRLNEEYLRFILSTEYIFDNSFYSGGYNSRIKIPYSNLGKRINVSLTSMMKIPRQAYFSVFAQLAYFGSDNYNIYFQQSFFSARLGLATSIFSYDKKLIGR